MQESADFRAVSRGLYARAEGVALQRGGKVSEERGAS
jgi:hypothetical protein